MDKDYKARAKLQSDFLIKDYELKANFLAGHHQRMWTRFSIFVTLESALWAGEFTLRGEYVGAGIALIGMCVSIVWFLVGWQDVGLLQVHEWHAKMAAERVFYAAETTEGFDLAQGFNHVGKVDKEVKQRARRELGWRIRLEPLKVFTLQVVPILTMVFWLIVLDLWLTSSMRPG